MLLNRRIPLRFFLHKIRYELTGTFIFANLVFFIKHYLNLEILTIPLTIPALLGTCIALLLGFRTNQAYERWWEARIAWGTIVNDSRTLIRQLLTFVGEGPAKEAVIRSFARRQIGWCYLLANALRRLPVTEHLQTHLTEAEVIKAGSDDHVPNAILSLHAAQLSSLLEVGQINAFQQVQLDATLSRLTDAMGRCERIKNTVFPRTYNFSIQFFIYLFTALLPFGLIENLFYVEVPLVTAIATTFFLIEKSAIQLQDPFENKPTDTPMTTLAQTVERNLRQMSGDTKLPEKRETQTYYSL